MKEPSERQSRQEKGDEQLLERLLGAGSDAARDGLDAETTRRLDDLDAEVQSLRASAETAQRLWSRRRERIFTQRILGRTTQEDLGWRGELRLVGGFLRERLSASPLLRVLAASLLLHLIALPTLGMLAYFEQRSDDGALITFDWPEEWEEDLPSEDGVGSAAPEEGQESESPGESLDADGSPPELARDDIENVLRRHRFLLVRGGGPVASTAPAEAAVPEAAVTGAVSLLSLRSGWLEQRVWPAWLEDPESNPEIVESPLQLSLLAELLLDHYAIEGTRSPRTASVLNALFQLPLPTREAALDRLVRGARERAIGYGLWAAPLGFDVTAVSDPLEADWLVTLGEALGSAAESDQEIVEAWTSWRRDPSLR